MKALIIGATGATGKDLVRILLEDPNYTEVVAFVRRASGLAHPKLVEVITDFDTLEAVADFITGDIWFSCLGTTREAAGSRENQWRIDHDIPAKFADIAKRHGVPRAVVVSAHGASATSRVFYSRMKGELDEHVAGLGFDQCLVFRPGLLLRKDTDRPGERLMARALGILNGLGRFRRYRPLATATLAGKLAKAPLAFGPGNHVIGLDEILRL